MTTAKAKRHSPVEPTPAPVAVRSRVARVVSRAARLAKTGVGSAISVVRHVPGTVRATRTGAQDTTAALQTLPDSTLTWLAATSVGLSAGLRLARAPRIVVAAGAVPALIAGAAIALRPASPDAAASESRTPTALDPSV